MAANLDLLHPELKKKALQLINEAAKSKLYIKITQGLRTIAEQNALYAQGRGGSGKIVTNAKGGQSYHNYGLAFDFAFTGADPYKGNFAAVGAIGKRLGLEWGGDWPIGKKDMPHFQLTFGLSIKQLLAGARPPKIQQPIINFDTMLVKSPGNPAIYAVVGNTLVPFATDYATFQKDFSVAKVQDLTSAQFANFKIASAVQITKK